MKCRVCETDKEPSDFYWKDRKAKRKDTTCKRCRIIQQRERTLGVTEEEYQTMHKDQNGRCGICKTRLRSKHVERFAVDHCHDSGRIRGLLCNTCNVGLGMLKDSPENLRAAIEWLKR